MKIELTIELDDGTELKSYCNYKSIKGLMSKDAHIMQAYHESLPDKLKDANIVSMALKPAESYIDVHTKVVGFKVTGQFWHNNCIYDLNG